MALQELQVYGLWAGKQTAKGTALAVPPKRYKQIGGAFQIPKEQGSQLYSTADMFPDAQDWVNTLVGNGNPQILCTPEELSHVLWLMEGGETTAAVTGPPAKTKHTVVPLPGLGHWGTWFERKGSSVVQRRRFIDSLVGGVEIGGSTGSKAVRITPTIISLDPGETQAADPVAAMPTKSALLYTDGTGRFTIDGTVFRGHSEFTLTINKDLQPVYSDDVVVYDLAIGNAAVTIGVTLYFDADGLSQWNKLIYGSSAPAANTKPSRVLPALGSYGFDLRARDAAGVANGDKFVANIAGVRWNVPDAPEPNPEGGSASITLSGGGRKSGVNPTYQIDIDSDAPAFTV